MMSITLFMLLPALIVTPQLEITAATPATTTVGGPTFQVVTDAINGLLAPLDDFAAQMEGMIDKDPMVTNTPTPTLTATWTPLSSIGNTPHFFQYWKMCYRQSKKANRQMQKHLSVLTGHLCVHVPSWLVSGFLRVQVSS